MAAKTPHLLKLRNLQASDYADIKAIMDDAYPGAMGGAWSKEQFASQLQRFPEGQICIEDHGKVIAAGIAVILDYDRYGDNHSYDEVTGHGFLTTHDPQGDFLYGVDLFVHKDYRGMRLGRRIYDARKELCRNLNLRGMIVGGRIPGYTHHAGKMSPEEYIEAVKSCTLRDPVLTFQLANDFHLRLILRNYMPSDEDSRAYATLLQWNNLSYQEKKQSLLARKKSVTRVGTVQWQMRRVEGLPDILQQIEYFVSALASYKADFALFPEFFNGPLLAEFNNTDHASAIRGLAAYTERIRDAFLSYAVNYNINIICGSMPLYHQSKLYNVCYLCRRDGTIEAQYKLHITPDEAAVWGLVGGSRLRTFKTDAGRIGILICYDVEFPELPRILTEQGLEILFVPFWTDTKTGYLRVRRCAQARAVENECYVAITGSVGNLPKVENINIQYSQSAVFSPSDFAFPHDAVMAETTPNTEMTLVVDLDLDKLRELRRSGSVRNFADRRRDLYKLEWLPPSSKKDPK